MILSCSACSIRYRVDDAAIPASGRTVRCRNCGHSWHEIPAAAPVEPVAAGPISDDATAPEEDFAPVPLHSETIAAEPAVDEPPVKATPIMIEGRPSASHEGVRSRRVMIGWIALAAFVIIAIAGLAVFRDPLVSAWPPAGRLYAAIGWPAHPGYGLQLSGVSVTPSTDNGKPILVLTGKISNASSVAMSIPKLHVFLLGDNQQVLGRLEMDAGKPNLHPGETTEFSLNIQDPPHDAAKVRVTLAVP